MRYTEYHSGKAVIKDRQILFKTKRLDNGEWVEGDLLHTRHADVVLISDFKDQLFRCDGNTLCQYTGLTDKNGNKIWENDILICHANEYDLERVVFGEFNVIDTETLEVVDRVIGWHTEVIKTDALSECEPFCLPMPLTDYYIKKGEVEVLGNIFDNADLLEVE